jgi:hypothetical protein
MDLGDHISSPHVGYFSRIGSVNFWCYKRSKAITAQEDDLPPAAGHAHMVFIADERATVIESVSGA